MPPLLLQLGLRLDPRPRLDTWWLLGPLLPVLGALLPWCTRTEQLLLLVLDGLLPGLAA